MMSSFARAATLAKGQSSQYEPVIPEDDETAEDSSIRISEESDIPLMEKELAAMPKKRSRAARILFSLKRTVRNPFLIVNMLLFQLGTVSLFLRPRARARHAGQA